MVHVVITLTKHRTLVTRTSHVALRSASLSVDENASHLHAPGGGGLYGGVN